MIMEISSDAVQKEVAAPFFGARSIRFGMVLPPNVHSSA